MSNDFSEINDYYTGLLHKMFEYDFPGKVDLVRQLPHTKARLMDPPNEYGSVEFHVDSNELATVENRLPIELEALDEDGIPIAVLLFVDDGKLNFLEVSKVDGSKIIKMPTPETFAKPKWKQIDDNTRVRTHE